jgi:hypothetical protein
MKIKYINLFLFSLFFVLTSQGQIKNKDNRSVLEYYLKENIFSVIPNAHAILISLPTEEIKSDWEPGGDVKYWSILQKYYPGLTKDSLKNMVAKKPKLKKRMISSFPKVEILNYIGGKKIDYEAISKKYPDWFICGISNFIYSKDRKTCIFYVYKYGESGYSVEIKKDGLGQWNSIVYTTDWMQ